MPTAKRRELPALRPFLDGLYGKYNKRKFVHPDPLEFLYLYGDVRDREIAGLVASSLACGRVEQILASVALALSRIKKPARFVREENERGMREIFKGFRHRFADGNNLAAMLSGAGAAARKHGSLGNAYKKHMDSKKGDADAALGAFVDELLDGASGDAGHLLPHPKKGSACKRLHLFLRWMVRKDAVDPGGWNGVRPADLTVPIDVHMHRIARALGMTARKSADAKAAREITDAFREISPADPVKYDFALTRFGIHTDMTERGLYNLCKKEGIPINTGC